jgi:leucyl/phenylalanyl-tRNA--protein transferase
MIPWLDDNSISFPATSSALAEPNGLLAVGGDLSTERLLHAYQRGIFPWYQDEDPILWWSPSPRCVVIPTELHISKSMQKFMRKTKLNVSYNQSFEKVVKACAAPRSYSEDTWITAEMYQAYCQLHQLGFARSVEVWQQDELVGGLYGIEMGKVFFGESMFSRCTNASKLAFISLSKKLKQAGFLLIDCQVSSPHLLTLGAKEIDREIFELLLAKAIKEKPDFSVF